jgi:hypothetical protein
MVLVSSSTPLGMVERQQVVGRRVDGCGECLRVLAEFRHDAWRGQDVAGAGGVHDRHDGLREGAETLAPPSSSSTICVMAGA